MTGAGLEHFTSLLELYLTDAKVTDAGLAHIKGLARLQILRLGRSGFHKREPGVGVTDTGLECVSGLAGLRELDLGLTPVTDEGLKHLKGLASLQKLDCSVETLYPVAARSMRLWVSTRR